MQDKELKEKIVKSKFMADIFVYLGFEYEERDNCYIFKRTYLFDIAWKRVHQLKNEIKELKYKII